MKHTAHNKGGSQVTPASEKNYPRFTFRCEPELRAALEAMKPKRMTLAAFIKQILDEWLANNRSPTLNVVSSHVAGFHAEADKLPHADPNRKIRPQK